MECMKDYQKSIPVRTLTGGWSIGPAAIPSVARRGHAVCLKPLVETATARGRDDHGTLSLALQFTAMHGRLKCMQVIIIVLFCFDKYHDTNHVFLAAGFTNSQYITHCVFLHIYVKISFARGCHGDILITLYDHELAPEMQFFLISYGRG